MLPKKFGKGWTRFPDGWGKNITTEFENGHEVIVKKDKRKPAEFVSDPVEFMGGTLTNGEHIP